MSKCNKSYINRKYKFELNHTNNLLKFQNFYTFFHCPYYLAYLETNAFMSLIFVVAQSIIHVKLKIISNNVHNKQYFNDYFSINLTPVYGQYFIYLSQYAQNLIVVNTYLYFCSINMVSNKYIMLGNYMDIYKIAKETYFYCKLFICNVASFNSDQLFIICTYCICNNDTIVCLTNVHICQLCV